MKIKLKRPDGVIDSGPFFEKFELKSIELYNTFYK